MDRHAEQRERKRRRASRGGKPMIVRGASYVRYALSAIERGAKSNDRKDDR